MKSSVLKNKLLDELDKLTKHSKLSSKDAKELADKINESLAKRYEKLSNCKS